MSEHLDPSSPASAPLATIVGDRLYGISIRPQELALYGENVDFDLRFSPIFDDPDEAVTNHFKMMVLEVRCQVPANDELALPQRTLQLLKCGWELELETSLPCPTAQLVEASAEAEHLLERIADTVNELARRAGLEVPLGPELVARLLAGLVDGKSEAKSDADR
ncbi:MAG: hypothetical protein ACYTF0_02265 [Planctomycetota bacterium]